MALQIEAPPAPARAFRQFSSNRSCATDPEALRQLLEHSLVSVRKLSREMRRYGAATRHHRTGWLAALPTFLSLYGQEKFSPDEIFSLGLLDPALSVEERRQFVSNEKMLYVQLRINGREASRRVDDKIEFQRVAETHGLPVPKFYATLAADGTTVGTAPVLRTAEDWERFWRAAPAEELIVKPAAGTHGQGVILVAARGERLIVNRQEETSARDLFAHMNALGYDHWLIQEAIGSHVDIVRLTGSRSLQTLRLVTIVRADGPALVAARFRINGGAQIFDNFDSGKTGNLIATLDPETGRVRHVKAGDPSGFGLRPVEHHPATGLPLVGYKTPLWDEAVAAARTAALAFAPAVTVGWDIGVTDAGVFLIEGNPLWDPLPGEPVLHIYEELLRAVTNRPAI